MSSAIHAYVDATNKSSYCSPHTAKYLSRGREHILLTNIEILDRWTLDQRDSHPPLDFHRCPGNSPFLQDGNCTFRNFTGDPRTPLVQPFPPPPPLLLAVLRIPVALLFVIRAPLARPLPDIWVTSRRVRWPYPSRPAAISISLALALLSLPGQFRNWVSIRANPDHMPSDAPSSASHPASATTDPPLPLRRHYVSSRFDIIVPYPEITLC